MQRGGAGTQGQPGQFSSPWRSLRLCEIPAFSGCWQGGVLGGWRRPSDQRRRNCSGAEGRHFSRKERKERRGNTGNFYAALGSGLGYNGSRGGVIGAAKNRQQQQANPGGFCMIHGGLGTAGQVVPENLRMAD